MLVAAHGMANSLWALEEDHPEEEGSPNIATTNRTYELI